MYKQLLFVLLFSAASLPALAQTAAPSGQYQYCTLSAYGLYGRSTELEYGQHAKPAVRNAELEQLSEEIKKLDSGVVALSYLCSHGWEYVNVSSLAPETIIYLLRRPAR